MADGEGVIRCWLYVQCHVLGVTLETSAFFEAWILTRILCVFDNKDDFYKQGNKLDKKKQSDTSNELYLKISFDLNCPKVNNPNTLATKNMSPHWNCCKYIVY